MRLVLVFLSICVISSANPFLDERQLGSKDGRSPPSDLPVCILPCTREVPPKFNCTARECLCDMNSELSKAMTTCVRSTCPSVRDQLFAIRMQARKCNFKAHTDAPNVQAIGISLFTVATVFLVLRLLYRAPRLNGAGYGLDDWCLLLCWLFALAMSVVVVYLAKNGSGKDLWLLSAEQLQGFYIWLYPGAPLHTTATYLTKMALVLLYLRIWTPEALDPGSRFRLLCWTILWVLLATIVASDLSLLFPCSPIEGSWSWHTGARISCIDRVAQGYALGGINILLDFVVFLLPVPKVLKLNIGWIDKLGVLTMFMIGFLVTICSVVRMFYIYQLNNVANITYAYNFVSVWSLVELYCTMICSCIPAASGLFRRYWDPVKERVTKSLRSVVISASTNSQLDKTDHDTELMYSRSGPRLPILDMEMGDAGSKSSDTDVAVHSVDSHRSHAHGEQVPQQRPFDSMDSRNLGVPPSIPHIGLLPDLPESDNPLRLASPLEKKYFA